MKREKLKKLSPPQISIRTSISIYTGPLEHFRWPKKRKNSADFKGFRGPLDFDDPRLMWKNAAKGER